MPHQEHPTAFDQVVQLLADYGFDGMAQAMQVLMNEAMKIERNEVLNAAPYERCSDRRGYANGYKPKTVNTRIGSLELSVPQTRDIEFYPKSLERGVRSERALKLAVAEMYVQAAIVPLARRHPHHDRRGRVAASGISPSGDRRLKGSGRPAVPEQERARVLAGLECVSYVTIFEDDTPERLIAAIRPDVLVKSAKENPNCIVGREFVESHGGWVVLTPVVRGLSTTVRFAVISGKDGCEWRDEENGISTKKAGAVCLGLGR